jgi:hypothetical protein
MTRIFNVIRLPAAETLLSAAILALVSMSCDAAQEQSSISRPTQLAPTPAISDTSQTCSRTIIADVVALEQAYVLNRFGAFVPAGLMYALKEDVVRRSGNGPLVPGNVKLRPDKRPRPLVLRVNEGDCLEVRLLNLLSPTWVEEGSTPEGDGTRLPAHTGASAGTSVQGVARQDQVSVDAPRTRAASLHITGLELVPISRNECPVGAACGGDGSNVGESVPGGVVFNDATARAVVDGHDLGSLAKPGQTVVTRWRAEKEGAYFAYSTAAPVGGEGDGGQIGLGLFASITVEPRGSTWFRSQVSHGDMVDVTARTSAANTAEAAYGGIDWSAKRSDTGRPILAMLDGNRIVHSDLNAIIVVPEDTTRNASASTCRGTWRDNICTPSFREFTVIMHDEVAARQAFAELEDENHPLSYLKDGMGINYGVSSMGSLVLSTPLQRRVGPARDCAECRAEEFFLSSWANGDPALLLAYNGQTPVGARYPDDPSNVHHSYLGDPVRFRNIHAGPKETHVFHLHAHQWVMDNADPDSAYLDSQTISPGASFSYDIAFGGSGNRNFTPGDSIFHCHLYPHFAQGMWELWRVHDTFENGLPGLFDPRKAVSESNNPAWRNLPDNEVEQGIATPAVIPIPGSALAPLPTADFRGYPFYIPGRAGHRPPQPPLDMDVLASAPEGAEPSGTDIINGGLPRHVVIGGEAERTPRTLESAVNTGGEAAQVIASRVATQNPEAIAVLAGEWRNIEMQSLSHGGEPAERAAMQFHAGGLSGPGFSPVEQASPPMQAVLDAASIGEAVTAAQPPHGRWWPSRRGYQTQAAPIVAGQLPRPEPPVFYVNGLAPVPGAPYANPCPEGAPIRRYRAAFIQTELTYNRHGWFDPQGRIIVLEDDIKDIINPATRTRLPEPLFIRANSGECIEYTSTNLIPSALNADDFQVFTPTDTIGQHIHLVKFDVTSSDGSANGWNYEDATFSPDEVRERIIVHNRTASPANRLTMQVHPLFRDGGSLWHAAKTNDWYRELLRKGQCEDSRDGESEHDYKERLRRDHPYCGAQRTHQRWWADPILNRSTGRDNTLRTVFTHDHLGPSSHQQHGLYAALVVEPANALWVRIGHTLTAAEKTALSGAAAQIPLTSDEQAKCHAEERRSNALADIGDVLLRARCKVLGGSDTSQAQSTPPWAPGHPLASISPRPPLRIRDDGGPTAAIANIRGEREGESRREFAIAIADFGIAYNAALEPINPEPRGDSGLRDNSAIRFGRRHVALTLARPLGISSEDPGSQYVNYRHEPLALRISEASPDPDLGGFNYRQARLRADNERSCLPGQRDCLGDTANAFDTRVHARREQQLATARQLSIVNPVTRAILQSKQEEARLDRVLADVEGWRRNFNCALYSADRLPSWVQNGSASVRGELCDPRIDRLEPWREFGDPATPIMPAFEGDPVQIRMVQGSQEAQHIFTMNGVKWTRQPGSFGSGYTNAQPIGISEHFEFNITVNPSLAPHVDYLWFGSSVDQLWDGMWGVMRSFRHPELARRAFGQGGVAPQPPVPATTDPAPASTAPGTPEPKPGDFLGYVLDTPPTEPGANLNSAVCGPPNGTQATPPFDMATFDVSAVRVCDLYGDCNTPRPSGIEYSRRYGIRDHQALVYVLNREKHCKVSNASQGCGEPLIDNDATLTALQGDFHAGRPLEPLVLRAPAGSCISVTLRNHLPVQLDDGPPVSPNGSVQETPEERAYHNFLPMITDGFNVNQFRMSSSVGLSAPRVAQNVLTADGSNVGLNGAVVSPGSSDAAWVQGALVSPCTPQNAAQRPSPCIAEFLWSATDAGDGNLPVEFGALPLRSFGDPIKHPMHGLGGALVIGPAGSQVCTTNRFAGGRRRSNGTTYPGGVSAEICIGNRWHHVDHVMMMQDAVNATRGGMPVGNLAGAEEPDDYGVKGLNYRTEPLWARRGNDPSTGFDERNEFDYSRVLSSESNGSACAAGIPTSDRTPKPCDPETPVFLAHAGETIRLHIVHPGGHTRQQGLAVSGHGWNPFPWSDNSHVLNANQPSSLRQGVANAFGPMMGVSYELTAGGHSRVAHDYLIRSQSSFLFDGGVWGLLRVRPADAATPPHRVQGRQ